MSRLHQELPEVHLPRSTIRETVERLVSSSTGLVVLAVLVGLGAGLGAVAFRYLILWFTILFTGHRDFSGAGHAANPFLPFLGSWFVVLAPVVGGLLYGPLTERFAPEARGHGVPEVMLAVAERGGRIRPRVAVIKALASAICIGAGGSVGREGPIVQIGSALGSSAGQVLGASASRLRLLVACGAAGGISATFNAPIAGVLFALELILRDFEAGSFGVVVLSSVAANIVGRAAFGSSPFLALPPFAVGSPMEFLLYAALGLLAGLVGVGFIKALYGLEDLADRLWRGPEWLRPVAGGVGLGLLLLVLPQMYGVGYPVVEKAVGGGYGAWILLALLGGKILATSLTIAIGGSGGVFAPSMFMGAMLGTAFGQAVRLAWPGTVSNPGAYGLVAMGAVFAAAARAPLTAAVIVFELTDEYRTILPLLFSVAIATGVSKALTRDTIYTLKLKRRGIDIERPPSASPMERITVAEAMRPAPEPLLARHRLGFAIGRLAQERREVLPVVDPAGNYRGTLTSAAVEQAIRDGGDDTTVGSLVLPGHAVTAEDTLESAVRTLLVNDLAAVPVIGSQGRSVVGWLTHQDVLRAYRARRERDGSSASRR